MALRRGKQALFDVPQDLDKLWIRVVAYELHPFGQSPWVLDHYNITKQAFDAHFSQVYSEASDKAIVEFDGARGRPSFNNELFSQLRDDLVARLGAEIAEELLNRTLIDTKGYRGVTT